MTQLKGSSYDIAISIARAGLNKHLLLYEEHLDEVVVSVLKMFPDVNPVKLRRELEALHNIFIPDLSVQDNFLSIHQLQR